MKDMMEYRDYVGSVHYSDEDEVFHGKLAGIGDLVTFEATDVSGQKSAFRDAVEDYLVTCEETGKPADKPFQGTFNVIVGSSLHKRAVAFANSHNESLNAVVAEALAQYLENERT